MGRRRQQEHTRLLGTRGFWCRPWGGIEWGHPQVPDLCGGGGDSCQVMGHASGKEKVLHSWDPDGPG